MIFFVVKAWIMVTLRRPLRRCQRMIRRQGVRRVNVVVPSVGDEKFFWRKAFDHNPLFPVVTDKIDCKNWVAEKGFDVLMPRTMWTGTDANDIPDALWKRPSFLKASHGYQMNIPLLTPPTDREEIIAQANAFLKREHGRKDNEWAYRHVKPRLLLEEALFVDVPMIETKFYTFGPVVEQFVLTRNGEETASARWLRQLDGGYKRDDQPTTHGPLIDQAPLPPMIDKALRLASEIGSHFDHIRVDTMSDGETLYLGELTVYNQAGRFHRQGHFVEAPVNRSWDLRKTWFMTTPQKGLWRLYANALRRALDRREA